MSQDDNLPPPPESPAATPPPPPQDPPAAAPPPPPPAAGGPPAGSPPAGSPPAGGGSSNRTVMLILSYLFLLALIPLLVEKDDEEIQWHAKHGLLMALTWFLISIVLFGMTVAIDWCFFGCATGFLSLALMLAAISVHVLAMIKAVNGERLRLPVISDLVEKF